ncbi:hypothetical protein [uncultured Polaribacter sp.]|uniref:hypothetical protein n=1 Tax=uncultured Polaribacter sp. TaxID=174711 RepID=UPI002610A0D5|nr:hypothetical protein [uncultured Polaribacter sp.]
MKRVSFYVLLLSFFMFSCDRNKSNIPIFSYKLQKEGVQKLKLGINEKENQINFEYLHEKDTVKEIFLKYNPEIDVLILELDTFQHIDKSYDSKSLNFKMYQSKNSKEQDRSLVFNSKYGLLASLAYGADFLFLKDSVSTNDKELIFKGIFLEMNKIHIE